MKNPKTQVLKDKVILQDGKEVLLPAGCMVEPVPVIGDDGENVITKVTLGDRHVLMHDNMDEHMTNMKIFQLTIPSHNKPTSNPAQLPTEIAVGELEINE